MAQAIEMVRFTVKPGEEEALVAERPRAVGVAAPEGLRRMGAVGASDRLEEAFLQRTTLVLLYALEGALRGVPWTALPKEVVPEAPDRPRNTSTCTDIYPRIQYVVLTCMRGIGFPPVPRPERPGICRILQADFAEYPRGEVRRIVLLETV